MQGRITKVGLFTSKIPSGFCCIGTEHKALVHVMPALQVLNMKPPEILGMLEEAAGTRMYESKKEAALRTLDKKQVKVEEINKVGYLLVLCS